MEPEDGPLPSCSGCSSTTLEVRDEQRQTRFLIMYKKFQFNDDIRALEISPGEDYK
ncbi:hypothetical protein GOP47_0000770, partial [Adiantum capillus-veneris]